jgi:hypothetical protein
MITCAMVAPPAHAQPAPAIAASAQARANFSGRLRERGSKLPIVGAVVTIFHDRAGHPEGFEATTDSEGRFGFYDLAPGTWRLLADPPGFFPLRTSETLIANQATIATYYVERGAYNPYDVTVTALRPRKEVSRTVIDVRVADKIPGSNGDPLAVVQNFPGVARTAGAGPLIVRGSAPEDSRIFVDGAEIPLAYHFDNLRGVLPTGVLDSIEFYPGNFSPRFGRATGGVVDIQIKQLTPPKLGATLDVNLLDSAFFVTAPLGSRGGLALAGRRSYLDLVVKAAAPNDDSGPVAVIQAPRYYDYQLLGNYRLAPGHDLRGLFFASDDQLHLLFNNPVAADPTLPVDQLRQQTGFYRAQLQYRYIPGPRLANDVRLALGHNQTQLRAGPLIVDFDVASAQLRDQLRFHVVDELTISAGFDGIASKTRSLLQLPIVPKEGEANQTAPDLAHLLRGGHAGQARLYPAGFVELEWRPWPRLLLLPGLRIDRFAQAREIVVQPRLTARLDLGAIVLKGGAGVFAQEANPLQAEDDPVFGNPALKTERARHYSLGLEYKPRADVSFDVTGFYKQLDHLVSRTPAGGLENHGSGRVFGLEAVARADFTEHFTGWIAYTLSRSQRRDSAGGALRLFDYDQTHNLTAVGSWLLPRNWQVGARLRLISGFPNTPVTGAVYDSSRDRYDPVYGPVNSGRNPLFGQLDVRLDKRWVFPRWMFSVYLDMQNVTNRANTEAPSYDFNFRQSRGVQGLPVLTIFGLRGEL